jgi:hypothetical protein
MFAVSHYNEDVVLLLVKLNKQLRYVLTCRSIQVACWFVSQNESRAPYQSAGDGHALAFTPRQLAWPVPDAILQPNPL